MQGGGAGRPAPPQRARNDVEQKLRRRSNAAWLAALGPGGDGAAEAASELRAYLTRVLARTFRGRFATDDLDELVQESSMRILNSLTSFRGDSAFSTWAAGIAIRVGFTELRRRAARLRVVDRFEDVEEEVRAMRTASPGPDEEAERGDAKHALLRAIETELTERQRIAILCELRGVPTVEIARRMDTNQNALYKLTHDARKRLKHALSRSGFDGAGALEGEGGAS